MFQRHIMLGLRRVLGLGTLALSGFVYAQASTSQPITLLIPYPPGGSADMLARPMLPELQKKLGQTIVLDYKGGAGGTIATSALARAKPDGHTLLLVLTAHAINDALYPKLPYDTRKDFAPVSLVATLPLLVAAPLSSPFNTIPELIAYAKANPDKLSYASAGNGNTSHLSVELFKTQTDTKMIHIPYKGNQDALNDVLSGQITMTFSGLQPLLSNIQTGKIKALVIAGDKRMSAIPEVPTVAELGLRGAEVMPWYGVIAPAGTPLAVVNLLNKNIAEIMSRPEIYNQFKSNGSEPNTGSPAQFAELIASDVTRWGEVIKRAGIQSP